MAKVFEVNMKFFVEAPDENVAAQIGDRIGAYIYRTDGIDSSVEEIKELGD